MLRQYFAELPEDHTFTSKELYELFEEVSPLFNKTQEKQIKKLLDAVLSEKDCNCGKDDLGKSGQHYSHAEFCPKVV